MIECYFEVSPRRTFAGALEWPGWCRSGKSEEAALEALAAYGSRYKRAMGAAAKTLELPAGPSGLEVVERIVGNATTEFGAPGKAPSFDEEPIGPHEGQRLQRILTACWRAFDKAARAATGKELMKGPRGGGRELNAIVSHVTEAEKSYLTQLGTKFRKEDGEDIAAETSRLRKAIIQTLNARAGGEFSDPSRRGKVLWSPRYFVRRDAWHVLDHAWEIEDRAR